MDWHVLNAVLSAALKSVVIFVVAGFAVRAFGRASAALRHAIWFLALASAAAVPVLSRFLPEWQPRWLPAMPASQSTTGAVAGWGLNWLLLATGLWAAGVVFLLVRLTFNHIQIMRITRRARPVGGEMRASFRKVRLLSSEEIEAPMTSGLFRPAILLPPDAEEWQAERRRAVLLHELAHIERLDTLLQTAAQIVCAFYWFNPLAWFALRMLRDECERACDDSVLARGVKPSDYARDLLDLACSFRVPALNSVAVAMAHSSRLQARLVAILDRGASRRPLSHFAGVAALAGTIALAGPIAALHAPQAKEAQPPAIAKARLPQPVLTAYNVSPADAPRPGRSRSAARPATAARHESEVAQLDQLQPPSQHNVMPTPVVLTFENVGLPGNDLGFVLLTFRYQGHVILLQLI